ncbi:hypothetical protein BGW39_001663 [Mortierella sp. 14UC]|nr:hypothetical protein BGW39_001663 [Mortierella sp. 14UC]
MPKSPRGNFNYIDINMYKPFNSASAGTTPTSSTAHSSGYRASAQETPQQQQFSNPAFSPTVHVPQSILASSSSAGLDGSDDGYQSSLHERPSHMTGQTFGYRPPQEHQQHQCNSSLESAPRPVFDALQHHQNIHQHHQSPQQQQPHGFQYQNFNQQRDHHLDNNNSNQGSNNAPFGNHNNTSVQHDQHHNTGQQSNHVPVPTHAPAGPPVQLINGMHPARLALLQEPEPPVVPPVAPHVPAVTEKQSKKKSKAEKAAAAAALLSKQKIPVAASSSSAAKSAPAPTASVSSASSSSGTLTLPAPAKSNGPKPKQVVPIPAKIGLKGEHLTVQLQSAITSKSVKKLTNVVKKAAGECIVRAFLYIMGRNFAFMSQGLFLALYREAFGCPNLADTHTKDSMLDAKLFKTMIETRIDLGPPARKFYRLSPVFFHVLEGRTNEQANIPPSRTKEPVFDVADRLKLPPITPLPPVMVRYLLDGWDLKLHNVSVMHYAFTPARWPTIAPLNDLQPFLAYWYTPQYQFSQHMTPLAIKGTKVKTDSATACSTSSSPAPNSPAPSVSTSQASASTPAVDGSSLIFDLLLETAKLQGKPGKEGRKLLRMHEQRLIDADMDVPPQLTAVLEDDTLSDNSDMELDDDDDDDAPAVIDLTPAPVPMTVYPPAENSTSTFASTQMIQDPSRGTALQEASQIQTKNSTQSETQSKDKLPDRTGGPVRFSMRQERFQPYADMHVGEGVFGSDGGRQRKSKEVDGTLTKNVPDLARSVLPSNRCLPTLPRPSLPPLDGQGGPSASSMTLAMLAGGVDSDMTTTEPLLRRSRDDILKQRRAALNKIIEYTMKLPMRMGSKD